MKTKLLLVFSLFVALTLVTTSCKESGGDNQNSESSLGAEKADLAMNDEYLCPMDCEDGKTYSEPGDCPKCNMALKKVEKDETGENDHEESHDDHSGHNHD